MSKPKFTREWFEALKRKDAKRALKRRLAITPAQLLAAVDLVKARREALQNTDHRTQTKRRGDAEHRAQVAVVRFATLARQEFPELELLFAIPNGGHRNVVVAKKLKAEGVRAGVPDLFLPVARGRFHGLFIEMKVKPNRPSPEQTELMAQLEKQGFGVGVCYTSAEAEAVLREYLAMDATPRRKDARGGMERE